MGLMKKFFRGGDGGAAPASASQFPEDEEQPSQLRRSQGAQRRELVQTVLRSTMRKHGIPSDWIECRALKLVSSRREPGMHVQFLVRKADHQLLPYVHAFQESFRKEIEQTDPDARDWLFSIGWEFHGKAADAQAQPSGESPVVPGAAAASAPAPVPTPAREAAAPSPGLAAAAGALAAAVKLTPKPQPEPEQSRLEDDDDLASDLHLLQSLVSTFGKN